MKGFSLTALLLTIGITLHAQIASYVTIDPDGYTNVREKPSVNAKILGTVSKHQIFATPDQSCYGVQSYLTENENWLPILISEEPIFKVGYIYRENIRSFDDFTLLNMIVEDSLSLYFQDKDMKIVINFEKMNLKKYENRKDITGYMLDNKRNMPFDLKSITITYKEQKRYMPEKDMIALYFLGDPLENIRILDDATEHLPYIVYKGHEEIYYLIMMGGDGGEMYSASWVIDGSEIVNYEYSQGTCSIPDLILK